MSDDTDFESLIDKSLSTHGDIRVRVARAESVLRRKFAEALLPAFEDSGLLRYELARNAGVKESQVRVALGLETGGKLELSTLCRIADVLGVKFMISGVRTNE